MQRTYCKLPYVPLGHQVMLVLWSDAVTYPLQHTSPQQVSAQLQPNSGETHSHFKCANVDAMRAPGVRRRPLSPGEKEEIAKGPQAVSKDFKTITCPEKPRLYRHLGATAATDIDVLLTFSDQIGKTSADFTQLHNAGFQSSFEQMLIGSTCFQREVGGASAVASDSGSLLRLMITITELAML